MYLLNRDSLIQEVLWGQMNNILVCTQIPQYQKSYMYWRTKSTPTPDLLTDLAYQEDKWELMHKGSQN